MADKLPDSKVIVIILAGSGRRDITKECFDQDKPIIVEASAPIVAVLQHSRPEWFRAPEAAVNGKILEIGPDFIGNKQRLFYALLLEEERPSVSLRSTLTDVVITRKSYYKGTLRPTIKWFGYWLLILACLTFIAWLIETYFWPEQALIYTYISSAYGFMILIGLALISGARSIQRDGIIRDILIPVRADPVSEDKSSAAAQLKETLKILNAWGYEARSRLVLARKLSMSAGGYCIRLSRVFTSAASWLRLRLGQVSQRPFEV